LKYVSPENFFILMSSRGISSLPKASLLSQTAQGRGLSPTLPTANIPDFPFEAAHIGFNAQTVDSLVIRSPSSMSAGIRTGSTLPVDHKQTSRSVSPLHLEEDQVRPPFTEASSDIKDKMAQIIDELRKKG
jgi:hypothetical protein